MSHRSSQHDWPTSPPPYPLNGHGYDIAMMLVRQGAEQQRQTEIMLATHERIIDLPDRLASRLAPIMQPPPPPPPPPTSASSPSLLARLGSVRDLVMLVAATMMFGAVLAGKMHPQEAASHMTCLAGGPCAKP